LGVEVRVNASLAAADATRVTLADHTVILAQTTIWTAGMLASPLARQIPGRHDRLGRLLVDRDLRAPHIQYASKAGRQSSPSAVATQPGRLTAIEHPASDRS
jgi:NADH dehydrogenase